MYTWRPPNVPRISGRVPFFVARRIARKRVRLMTFDCAMLTWWNAVPPVPPVAAVKLRTLAVLSFQPCYLCCATIDDEIANLGDCPVVPTLLPV